MSVNGGMKTFSSRFLTQVTFCCTFSSFKHQLSFSVNSLNEHIEILEREKFSPLSNSSVGTPNSAELERLRNENNDLMKQVISYNAQKEKDQQELKTAKEIYEKTQKEYGNLSFFRDFCKIIP
jgi:sensor histidine kinase YesM